MKYIKSLTMRYMDLILIHMIIQDYMRDAGILYILKSFK